MEWFHLQKQVTIQNGQLDLRDWRAEDGDVLLLDGEWEFYPSQWLVSGDRERAANAEAKLIHVPGGWNEALNAERPTPYGYGSYRLILHVDPSKNQNYSVRVPSVRTSSELYVNGRLLAGTGGIADTKEGYTAKNLPYSTTFTADENGVIELVIQAANYVDSRNSGIARSIKFGSEEAVAREMKISVSMQLMATVIFLMHSVYAFILFLIGNREKKLLFFSLLTLCISFANLLSNDEKLFHQLFYIGTTWDFRLANCALMLGIYALLQCTNHREIRYWRRISPFVTVMILGAAVITLFLQPEQIIQIFPVYMLSGGIAIVVTVIAIAKAVIRDIRSNLLLLVAFLVLVHHYVWSLFWRDSGLSLVYYPFDQIVAMGCLASVWFKQYFSMHAHTKEIAATLQRMNDRKDQFLANTSHEFRNPLHSILNMSQTVLNRERHLMQARSVKELETVQTVGRRLTLILNDLIDVMSLREGNPRLHKTTVSIQSIVTGVLDMLQYNAEAKSLRIANEIPVNFPSVYADENRVIQIVFNLLHNAVKYTNEGSIVIQAAVKDGRVHITIKDTGIGMEEEMLKRLFRPYEQANRSDTMIEGGFGLGLSICKQLVELHGGTLEVSSEAGEGSTFTFSLELAEIDAKNEVAAAGSFDPKVMPSLPVEEAAASSADAPPLPQAVEINRDRPCLLIVDDDPVNLQVLESILPSDEYEAAMVTSGKEALALLDQREWDLVISDIMMPQMSGYELARIIRERFSLTELPILLITARSQPEDIQSGFIAGANDYVTKPVDATELKSRIKALITIKQSVREQQRLEAAWLQAQIQPHFLFNALNAVTALSNIDLNKMRSLLDEFSNFLRNKFKFHNMDGLVPVEEELSLVHSYLYIEQVRFDERLKVNWEIGECRDLKVPFLSIQPLVENAIIHGVMKRVRGGRIDIRIAVHDMYTEVTVEDDGIGMDEDQLERLLERQPDSQSGVGLINTDQRLKRHFGTGLQISSQPGNGTKITFHVRKK